MKNSHNDMWESDRAITFLFSTSHFQQMFFRPCGFAVRLHSPRTTCSPQPDNQKQTGPAEEPPP
jgi:hypothetical protein